MRSSLRLLVLGLCLLFSFEARAADPKPAERLHEAAVGAYRAGRLRQAIELWRDALKLDPNWKYAYNLANTLYENQDGVEAWDALKRARSLSPPDKYVGQVAELGSKVRAFLYKDHAWLVLDVATAGAKVTLDGAAWAPPYEAWVTTREVTVEVSANGYITRTDHIGTPVGEKVERRIALDLLPNVEKPKVGILRVDGTPLGARVLVAGIDRGELPLAPIELEPGLVNVRVTHPGFVDESHDVRIAAGEEAPVQVALPRQAEPVTGNGLATPGWITLAGGVVLAGIGTGMLVWTGDTRDDLEKLNRNTEIRGPEYSHRYDELRGVFDDRLLASQLLLGVGAAAVVTGVVLILLDESPSANAVTVVPTAGGALVLGGASF